MRSLAWIILCAMAILNTGCVMDKLIRTDGKMVRTGVSPQARQIEDSTDWGPNGF